MWAQRSQMRRDNGQKSYALAMLVVAVLMGPRKGASVGAAFDLPRENLYARKLWLLSLYPCLHPPAVSFQYSRSHYQTLKN